MKGDEFIAKIAKRVKDDVIGLGHNGHKNMTEGIKLAMENIYVSKNAPGLDRHPKGFLDNPYV